MYPLGYSISQEIDFSPEMYLCLSCITLPLCYQIIKFIYDSELQSTKLEYGRTSTKRAGEPGGYAHEVANEVARVISVDMVRNV